MSNAVLIREFASRAAVEAVDLSPILASNLRRLVLVKPAQPEAEPANTGKSATSADRWFAGMCAAQFNPLSKAYAQGHNMNEYLRRVVGSAHMLTEDMAVAINNRRVDHTNMDALLHFAEKQIPVAVRRKILHAGIALALFESLDGGGGNAELVKLMRSALMLSAGYGSANPSDAVVELAAKLDWLAEERVRTKMLEISGGRNQYYRNVATLLGTTLRHAA